MKKRFVKFFVFLFVLSLAKGVSGKEEIRKVSPFSEISLAISGTVYLEQGIKQSVRIVARDETLEKIITEVNNRTLKIRFPNSSIFNRTNPGKIEIYITVPEIDGLSVSGSGDIVAPEIRTRILDLAVSGSGNIKIDELQSERIKGAVSGSGSVTIGDGGIADELKVNISGSGNFNAAGFEASEVAVQISGSGNCRVNTNGTLKARIAGSGNVYYRGNPTIESSVAGSGKVREM